MRYLIFKPELRAPILEGLKTQTVRTISTMQKFSEGEEINLRYWTGSPMRSQQKTIATVLVHSITPVIIFSNGFSNRLTEEHVFDLDKIARFARKEGFSTWREFTRVIDRVYELPFVGGAIEWR